MRRFLIAFLLAALATPVLAYDDQYEITPDRFSGGLFGEGIQMRKKYGSDTETTYRGTIDNWGEVRLRNGNGDTVRGRIDKFGGTLHDEEGNTWRVSPRYP
jgi:hypothetical protein